MDILNVVLLAPPFTFGTDGGQGIHIVAASFYQPGAVAVSYFLPGAVAVSYF